MIQREDYRFISGPGIDAIRIDGGTISGREDKQTIRGEDYVWSFEATQRLNTAIELPGRYIRLENTIISNELFKYKPSVYNVNGTWYFEDSSDIPLTGGLVMTDMFGPEMISVSFPDFSRVIRGSSVFSRVNEINKFGDIYSGMGVDTTLYTMFDGHSSGHVYEYDSYNDGGTWKTREKYATDLVCNRSGQTTPAITNPKRAILYLSCQSGSIIRLFSYGCNAEVINGHCYPVVTLQDLEGLIDIMLSMSGIYRRTGVNQHIVVGGRHIDVYIPMGIIRERPII